MRHQHISWLKSVVRLVGYIYLPIYMPAAALILIGSEILGIAEEVGHE